MDTIFMNSENSKSHVLKLELTSKLDLRLSENNKFKISAPTWNDEFELPVGFYSVSDIQDYFKYILKKHGENTNKPSVQIYLNKIENRTTFKIEHGYSLELLAKEAMKLLGSIEKKQTN